MNLFCRQSSPSGNVLPVWTGNLLVTHIYKVTDQFLLDLPCGWAVASVTTAVFVGQEPPAAFSNLKNRMSETKAV